MDLIAENHETQLRVHPIGGLLVVLQQWDSVTEKLGTLARRLVGAPDLSQELDPSTHVRVQLGEACDWESFLDLLRVALPSSSVPMMVSSDAMSYVTLEHKFSIYIASSAPLDIIDGATLESPVLLADKLVVHWAINLPCCAHLPLGLAWPLGFGRYHDCGYCVGCQQDSH